ncbi:hypothetical protein [Streptomyces sioyaensis]|uniref:hypothetical protein n=1 Tax=Streptomyces sioyaensis TaxID=67364 RepID=UPI00378BA48F
MTGGSGPRADALSALGTVLQRAAHDLDDLESRRVARVEERMRLAADVSRSQPPGSPAQAAAAAAVRAGEVTVQRIRRLAAARRQALSRAAQDIAVLTGGDAPAGWPRGIQGQGSPGSGVSSAEH